MAMPKDMKKVIRAAEKRGWIFEQGRVHGRLTHPSGRRLAVSVTPSDGMAHRQVERDIERVEKEADDVGA